jgi:hypothetical protein
MRDVVGHDRQAIAKCGRRDPDIIVTDWLSKLTKVAANARRLPSDGFIYFQEGKKTGVGVDRDR